MGSSSMSAALAAGSRALDQLQEAGRALDTAGIPTHDDHGAPLSFRIRLALALEQRSTVAEAGLAAARAASRAHTPGQLVEFCATLGRLGVHLPIEGVCHACRTPWPCHALPRSSSPTGPGAASPVSPASSSVAEAAPVDRAHVTGIGPGERR
jgi:hypothetical protein